MPLLNCLERVFSAAVAALKHERVLPPAHVDCCGAIHTEKWNMTPASHPGRSRLTCAAKLKNPTVCIGL